MPTTGKQIEPSTTSAGVELFVVPREQVVDAWADIEKFLDRVEAPQWGPVDVFEQLLDGRAIAWGLRGDAVRGFWITRIEETSAHRFGLVWICAGAGLRDGLEAYRSTIEPWFWDKGCEWIEIIGRRGWSRVLPDYRECAVTLRKYGRIQTSV